MSDTVAAQDAALASVGMKTAVYGYGASLWGLLSDAGFAIAIGTIITIIGFGINWYYQRKRTHKELEFKAEARLREKEQFEWARAEHLLRLQNLRAEYQCRVGGVQDSGDVDGNTLGLPTHTPTHSPKETPDE